MQIGLVDLLKPLNRDSVAVVGRERMLGFLEFEPRSRPCVSEVCHDLETKGVRVAGNPNGEPAEEWAHMRLVGIVEDLAVALEIGLADRAPSAPREGLRLADDRNFEAPSDEEVFAVDGAEVGCENAALLALVLGHRVVVVRRCEGQVGEALVELSAGCTRESHAVRRLTIQEFSGEQPTERSEGG